MRVFLLVILVACERNPSKSFANFERRFRASKSRLIQTTGEDSIPESMLALILVNNAGVDSAQRTSIFASCARHFHFGAKVETVDFEVH